jgi:hypothetical protein
MNEIPCIWIERTPKIARWLRRWRSCRPEDPETHCTVQTHGYHQAWVRIADRIATEEERGPGLLQAEVPDRSDLRWPPACACGYVFRAADEWQVFVDWVYQSAGEELPLRDWGLGAMWDAPWFSGEGRYVGPDGRCLVVRTPGGDWPIDLLSTESGGRWTRTGEPPKVTVTPSIIIGNYHGWLRDGALVAA